MLPRRSAFGLLAVMAGITPASAHVVQLPASGEGIAQAIAALPTLRDSLPAGEPVELVLPAGRIRLTAPLLIDAAHGGTAAHPLILRGADKGETWLSGAAPLTTRMAMPRDGQGRPLPAGTLALDLRSLPFAPLLRPRGTYVDAPEQGLLLFQGNQRLFPTRWPAQTRLKASVEGSLPQGPKLHLPADMPAALWQERAAYVGAYWGAVWNYELAPLQSLSATDHSAQVAPLRSSFAGKPEADFALFNLVSQLGQTGRFYLDPIERRALLTPTAKGGAVEVAIASGLLRLQGTAHVTLRHVGFERATGDLVSLIGSHDSTVEDCHFRQSGRHGLVVQSGLRVAIHRVVVEQTGETGIILNGGDRASLTRGDNAITDSVVAEFGQESPTYRPGVKLEGVGNSLRSSLVRGGPHAGVILWGNDLSVERNEIAQVLRDAEDMGAVYMGADWTLRGNRISNNYIHGLGGRRETFFLSAIYLDDQFSSADVTGNLLVGGDHSLVIGGGRDNHATGNVMLSPKRAALHFDARGLTFQAKRREEFATKAARVPYHSALWLQHYPALATLVPESFGHPAGNLFSGNLVLGGKMLAVEPADLDHSAMLEMTGNQSAPASPSPAMPVTALRQLRLPDGSKLDVVDQSTRLKALVETLASSANAGRVHKGF